MIASIFSEECAYSLMAEVGATPKPGLVDRHDSGAHTDMNYDTFAASTKAITPAFLHEETAFSIPLHQYHS